MKSIRGWFWRFFIRRAALRQGFIDPVAVMSRLRRFAHTSEVSEPLELVRAGMIFHARGLLNTRAIQHNLDWVWPYWVERQFDPADESFVPRAFSVTHVNLTHRNWTATGLPDCEAYPLVDPRGLVTPFFDGWSLDAWVIGDGGGRLFPSRQKLSGQTMARTAEGLEIRTITHVEETSLSVRVHVEDAESGPVCRIRYTGHSAEPAWLVVTVRPCNPEGVSLVEDIKREPDRRTWRINGPPVVQFDPPMERHFASNYREGDVLFQLPEGTERSACACPTGMATAAALFRVEPGRDRRVEARVFLREDETLHRAQRRAGTTPWSEALKPAARVQVPDQRIQELYDQALYTLILLTPGDVFPGPYTYKRFWFRDASFILHALLCAGLSERVGRVLARYPGRQKLTGYFHSQDGEWDSNGEALWIMDRYLALCPGELPADWRSAVEKGVHWILRKRIGEESGDPHAGLMPPGFSAEHLGPNDYYYWDNFWSMAGLRAAARLLKRGGSDEESRRTLREADAYLKRIEDTLAVAGERLGRPAMPAAPDRRLDTGAVGSLAAGYPLQLWPGRDPRLRDTAAYLMEHCFVGGGFFQDMIHSGVNAYLTLHVAQVLLRAGDVRFADLVRAVADMASPTGQWPEAIHPRTGGGCMGDGHHAWASAEWVMMIRNMFLREEGDTLMLGTGIMPDWQVEGKTLSFGPGLTSFGRVEVHIAPRKDDFRVGWKAQWHEPPETLVIALPEQDPVTAEPSESGERVIQRRGTRA